MALNRREFLRLAGVSCGAALGCGRLEVARSHVVCVVVDRLRLSAFQEHAPLTRARAMRGALLTGMRSVAPWTYPSVISLMSGLHPQQHGADGEIHASKLTIFSPAVPLLQHRLRAAGYRTAAFVTHPHLFEWNPFHVGFDTFRADFTRDVDNRRADGLEYALPDRMFSPSVNREIRAHFDDRPVDAPEFTYVHYLDAHGPWAGAPFEPDYAPSLHFLDGRIVELHDYFLERYGGDLYFFVTSDHGRAIGDDLKRGYGEGWRADGLSVHDFNLRIPFALLPGARAPTVGSLDFPCSNVDLVPTVLELLGLDAPIPLAGRSLASALLGGRAGDPERPIYARQSAFGWASDCLVIANRKYLRHFHKDGALHARRIFDLEADPDETRSLGSDFGAAEESLRAAARQRKPSYAATARGVPRDVARIPRALGVPQDRGPNG